MTRRVIKSRGHRTVRTFPTIEALEQRQMLSASVSNELLTVSRTPADDQVAVWSQQTSGGGKNVVARPTSALSEVSLPPGPIPPLTALVVGPPGTSMVQPQKRFVTYDAINYTGTPDLSARGLPRVYVAYSNEMFRMVNGAWDYSSVDEKLIRATADKAAALGQMLVLDIESWSIDPWTVGNLQALNNLAKYMQAIDWVKNEQPNLKVSVYDAAPVWYGEYRLMGSSAWTHMKDANTLAQPLIKKLDFFALSFYTMRTDYSAWYVDAQQRISLARAYNKPIYGFLQPVYPYCAYTPLASQPIPAADWEFELETMRRFANGAVIWTDPESTWDENAPWWNVTQQTIQYGSKLPSVPYNVTATPGQHSVSLAWAGDSFSGGYIIERSDDGIHFQQVQALPADNFVWTDNNVYRRAYYYRVYAFSGSGASGYSRVVQATPT